MKKPGQVELISVVWSHNPLITLKLICNRRADGLDRNARYGGILASPNHRKTLAHSVMSVAGLFVDLTDHLEVL